MTHFLPYGRQTIEEDDVAAVAEALRGDYLTTGPRVDAFEAALAEATGAAETVACNSGTAALHLAAMAARLGPGDQAIVPAVTFLATANAPHFTGAEVVFADVDPESGLMTEASFAEALERAPRARAAFPVHLNGRVCDMPALAALAARRGVMLIEDACHALGAAYPAGDGGLGPAGDGRCSAMACFSFHPVKAIAMGEAGAVATNDPALAARCRILRNHGMSRDPDGFSDLSRAFAFDAEGRPNPWFYEMAEPGYNYRVSDILCALGLSQLKKLPRFLRRRREIADLYDRRLAPLSNCVRPTPRAAAGGSGWHLYVALIEFEALGIARGEGMRRLAAEGIGTQVHYLPVHLQPFYRRMNPTLDLPGAMAYYRRALSLPIHPAMTDGDVERVAEALARALQPSG